MSERIINFIESADGSVSLVTLTREEAETAIAAILAARDRPGLDDLRWIILRGGLRLPGFDHWRQRSTSKPSDPDDVRWDCSCGYAGSPETVERHWIAMDARLAQQREGAGE